MPRLQCVMSAVVSYLRKKSTACCRRGRSALVGLPALWTSSPCTRASRAQRRTRPKYAAIRHTSYTTCDRETERTSAQQFRYSRNAKNHACDDGRRINEAECRKRPAHLVCGEPVRCPPAASTTDGGLLWVLTPSKKTCLMNLTVDFAVQRVELVLACP